jgi:hypothetical protein
MTLNELIRRLQELEAAVADTEPSTGLSEKILTDVLGTLVLCRLNLTCATEVDRVETRGFAVSRSIRRGGDN